ncbi:MAG: LssY C-terminal domain-containing protein [Propionibacteriales bacterium]|nr:LssY C-terminal domain-containing protein [Propionibacteriales bacterium]
MRKDQRNSRHVSLRMQQPLPVSTLVDRGFFLIATVYVIWLAVIVAIQGFRSPWSLILLIPVWGIFAYLALPRLHRMLSDLYVPDYFFGRTRTSDGLLGDPVNMAVDGSFDQLHAAMTRAGWHRAEEITARTAWLMIVSTVTGRSYPTAPVSTLMLFGRRHDVAYQQEVAGNPKQRHHVRFWHTPPGWLLPGGTKVDWLGAGTYDTAVGISWFTLQVTHRIDENTDIERDFVVSSITSADPAAGMRSLPNFTTGYHSRNGGGDRFITDGALPILDLASTHALESGDGDEIRALTSGEAPSAHDAYRRAPLSALAAGILTIGATALDCIVLTVSIFTENLTDEDGVSALTIRILLLCPVVILLAVNLLLVRSFLRRGRRSRVVLMTLLSLSILLTALNYILDVASLRLDWGLLSASLQCIALISFATDSTARWVRARQDDEASGAAAVTLADRRRERRVG